MHKSELIMCEWGTSVLQWCTRGLLRRQESLQAWYQVDTRLLSPLRHSRWRLRSAYHRYTLNICTALLNPLSLHRSSHGVRVEDTDMGRGEYNASMFTSCRVSTPKEILSQGSVPAASAA